MVYAITIHRVRFDETGDSPTGFLEGIIPNPVDLLLQGFALIGAAIAAFFEDAVAFLGELGMAVIGAIGAFLGQVAEAVEKVGEVLSETASLILRVAKKLIRDVLQRTLGTIPELMDEMVLSFGSVLVEAAPSPPSAGELTWDAAAVANALVQVLLPVLIAVVLALTSILVLEIILGALAGGLGFILSTPYPHAPFPSSFRSF